MLRSCLLLAAVCCAATAGQAQSAPDVARLPGQLNRTIIDSMGTPFEIPAPPNRAFQAVVAAYGALKIPITVRDTVAGHVGNGSLVKRVSLGGQMLSNYLMCGEGMMGPYANSHKITMYLISTVTPTGEGHSTLRTVLIAGAVNVAEGTGRDPIKCESTGVLELRIRDGVLEKTNKP